MGGHFLMGTQGSYLYRPDIGAYGQTEYALFDTGLASADAAIGTLRDDVDILQNYVDSRTYSSINAAVLAIGSTPTTLIVSNSQTLAASLTLPSTLTLKVLKGGSIVEASSYTLTINGPFEAGPYQVFSGFSAGDITFGVGAVEEVYGDWFATNTTPGTTDMAPAFRCAVQSITEGVIKGKKNSIYLFDSKTTVDGETPYLYSYNNDITFDGNGATFTTGGKTGYFWFCRPAYTVSLPTFYNIENAVRGDISLTLSTSADASNFVAGDLVRISNQDSPKTWIRDAGNRIISVSGGILYLQYPLGKNCNTDTPGVANVTSVTTQRQTLKNMKVLLGNTDLFNVWQSVSDVVWENLEIEEVTSSAQTIQFWNSVFESRITNCKFIIRSSTGNGIGPGDWCSSHAFITNNIIIQNDVAGVVYPARAGEGSEDVHIIGNTIINLNDYSGTGAVDLSTSYDTVMMGNTVYTPSGRYALNTDSGWQPSTNALITGNTFHGGYIRIAGLDDNFTGNTLYNCGPIDVLALTPASVVGNYIYSNNAPTYAIVVDAAVGSWKSTIAANTLINTGTSGTHGIYVTDPGSSQPYSLTIIGNNIQGFTNKLTFNASANVNLPNKRVFGNTGVHDLSSENITVDAVIATQVQPVADGLWIMGQKNLGWAGIIFKDGSNGHWYQFGINAGAVGIVDLGT